MTKFEAAVIGAGPAGLAAALALAHRGVEVAVVAPAGSDPAEPAKGSNPAGLTPGQALRESDVGNRKSDASGAAIDQRTTALMRPSLQLLRNLDVLAPTSDFGFPIPPRAAVGSDPQGLTPAPTPFAPIVQIRIADDRGGLVRAPEIVFRASELGLDSFGANIANPLLLAALRAAAERSPRIAWVPTGGVTKLVPEAFSARLELAEGGAVEASLAVAADGRNSKAPAAAGIPVRTWVYPQEALVCSFGHSRPHKATVNELHRHRGPLTTVPLPGRRCGLVWVEAPDQARRLAGIGEAAFAAELEERLQGVLGSIGEVGPRAVHGLSGRQAERMGAARVALVGEAAHVIAPIGAQGLNLGLRDAAALADCVAEAKPGGGDIGGDTVLAAYQRTRGADVLARSVSIDLLNRSLLTDLIPLDMLRGLAAHALASFAPLRRALMREGMGLAGPLPSLMR